jgi:class 3 adenylate cyclase
MVQEPSSRVERRLSAILAADVVAYSRLMHHDEEATHARLTMLLAEAVEPSITQHGGRVVKNTGDGFLAEFQSGPAFRKRKNDFSRLSVMVYEYALLSALPITQRDISCESDSRRRLRLLRWLQQFHGVRTRSFARMRRDSSRAKRTSTVRRCGSLDCGGIAHRCSGVVIYMDLAGPPALLT